MGTKGENALSALRLSGKPRDSHLVPHGKTGRGVGPAQSEAGLTQEGSLSFSAVSSPELRLLPLQPENPLCLPADCPGPEAG